MNGERKQGDVWQEACNDLTVKMRKEEIKAWAGLGEECADRIKDMNPVCCCSHCICLGCSSGWERTFTCLTCHLSYVLHVCNTNSYELVWYKEGGKKRSLLRQLFPFLGQGLFFPVMRADLLVNFTKWKKPEQMTQTSLLLFIIKRHNRTEQDCLLKTTAHTHAKQATTFWRLKNGSCIWFKVGQIQKGQLWPVGHSTATMLQQAYAHHIVITRFIFGLRILFKQAFGVTGAFPSSPALKCSKARHVCTRAL